MGPVNNLIDLRGKPGVTLRVCRAIVRMSQSAVGAAAHIDPKRVRAHEDDRGRLNSTHLQRVSEVLTHAMNRDEEPQPRMELRALREALKVTRPTAAELSGVSLSRLRWFETAGGSLTAAEIQRLARALAGELERLRNLPLPMALSTFLGDFGQHMR